MKKWWIAVSTLLFAGLAQAQSMGAMQVNGQAGSQQLFQKVKAVRCQVGQRGACDAAVFFDLNKQQALNPGTYIVGFENSIYPELVTVNAGRVTNLYLERVTVPSQVKGAKIRVYRDFTSLVEQKKIYLTMFMMNRHFFRLDKDNFGDLYLAGLWERDFVQRFTYEVCPRIDAYGEVASSARAICKSWNSAKTSNDLRDLYNFANDGTFQEMWVTFPGDVIASKHPRYLVSAPITAGDFVAVFPGVYKVQAEGKNQTAVTVKTGQLSQNASNFGFSLNAVRSFISLDGEDCSTARTWKTDSRSYCTSDSAEGCDRSSAESCEPM
ncbi:hypothetical protein AZI85_04140 [Bdellovibrio bacteriovorus]|uniref:Uncharacterized protein n=1 Tax=Bdellovibrio bacteriovorus TaxID=959 RepID=A0A150WLE1_BDEBC|nr:hypothetical protein [Bdellovibrio bacteriovorus]KYG64607.1 hypothetical protein AZI85_04140 [Bdellovibrio bacteriovorus]